MSAETMMRSFICLGLCLVVAAYLTITNRAAKAPAAADARDAKLAQTAAALDPAPSFRRTSYSGLGVFAPAQGPPADKLVDETRKNIQVLKGLPEPQLFPLMNFVASSLGVQCGFCHVQQGKDPKTGFTNWVWDSDDKPEKQTARRMMRMVQSLNAANKADFSDNTVTCYTCHRGQTEPVGLPSMPLVRSGHEPGPNDAPPSARTSPPSVDQILTRYLEAVGGTAAAGTKTLVLKGRREASQNRNWSNEITFAAPDKLLVVATPTEGVVRQIVNGDKGWVVSGTNVRTLTLAEVTEARRSWDELFNVVKMKRSPAMKFGGIQKIGERDVYLVKNATNTKTERYYFDTQTGLLLRKMTVSQTVLIPIPEQLDFEDYRQVDGVKVPFTIRYSAIDTFNSWTRTFTEIKRDASVDDTLFAMPVAPPK